MSKTRVDHTGKRYGKLVAKRIVGSTKCKHMVWLCKCDCGNTTTVASNALRTDGRGTKSCGCLNYKHGMSTSRLYNIHQRMLQRCTNPNDDSFDLYGGRGITVCPEWEDFNNFVSWSLSNGYSGDLTLDRRDNNSGYSPTNCRWITQSEQNRNKNNNVYITAFEETKVIYEWSKDPRCKVGRTSIMNRLNRGMSPEEAISTPPKRPGNKNNH